MTVVVGDKFTVFEAGRMPVTTMVDSYGWTCHQCDWRGTGHTTQTSADAEARRHWKDEHGVEVG